MPLSYDTLRETINEKEGPPDLSTDFSLSNQHSGTSFEFVRQIALSFPGVEEGSSYGTPAFRIRDKFFARMKEDGETLVVKIDELQRDALINLEPEIFYITEHYRNYPSVLVRLSVIRPEMLHRLFEYAWRRMATKGLIAQYHPSV